MIGIIIMYKRGAQAPFFLFKEIFSVITEKYRKILLFFLKKFLTNLGVNGTIIERV